jgi:hypothetical protein
MAKKPDKPRSNRDLLSDALDQAALALLKQAYGDSIAPASDNDPPKPEGTASVASIDPKVFNAVVGWVRVKHKIDPEGEHEPSGLERLTAGLR